MKVKGTVIGKQGETLPGATIREKGTNNIVISDYFGNFEIDVLPGSTLEITYIGWIAQEKKIIDSFDANIIIEMEEDNYMIDPIEIKIDNRNKKGGLAWLGVVGIITAAYLLFTSSEKPKVKEYEV